MKILKYLLLAILALVVIFFGRGLLTSSVSYESEVEVDKTAREAWAYLSDVENLPKWIDGFKRSELVSGEANTVGAVSKNYIEQNGQEMVMTETITKYDEPNHIAMDFAMDFMNMGWEMFFTEADGKTKLRSVSNVKGNGFMAKAMVAWMQGGMKKQEDANMAKLQKLINENTKDYFPEPVVDPTAELAEEASMAEEAVDAAEDGAVDAVKKN